MLQNQVYILGYNIIFIFGLDLLIVINHLIISKNSLVSFSFASMLQTHLNNPISL